MSRRYIRLVGLFASSILACSVYSCAPPASSFSGCQSDNDCPGQQYCVNNACVDPIPSTLTNPQEVFDLMVQKMERGDLETVIDCCWDPDYKEMYHSELGGKDLVHMAAQLKGKTLNAPQPGSLDDGANFRQYNLNVNGIEYSPIFVKKQDGTWRISKM